MAKKILFRFIHMYDNIHRNLCKMKKKRTRRYISYVNTFGNTLCYTYVYSCLLSCNLNDSYAGKISDCYFIVVSGRLKFDRNKYKFHFTFYV